MLDLAQAIQQGLHDLLKQHDNVRLLGEDVGLNGGVFRVTDGLQVTFGPDRVIDTPLAENMLAGIALGMATQGLFPIVEFQFMAFMYPAMEQIKSHISCYRTRTQGRLTCPMIMRTPYGSGVFAPEHHSESTEALFCGIPGLRVVVPSTPQRAYALLMAAYQCQDPVLFLEPTLLYRTVKQPVDPSKHAIAMDQAIIEQPGEDLTLIAWGAMMQPARQVQAHFKSLGVSCELIDLVSLNPVDYTSLTQSVQKTKRCVIIQEAANHMGLANQIAGVLQAKAWGQLKQPILTISGYDCCLPYPQLEKFYKPDTQRIINEVSAWMK